MKAYGSIKCLAVNIMYQVLHIYAQESVPSMTIGSAKRILESVFQNLYANQFLSPKDV